MAPAAPSSSFRSLLPVLIGVFLLALAVRIAYLLAFRESPFFLNLAVDSQWHDEWAWEWTRGIRTGDAAFFRAPLYPLWLSGIYAAFGHDLLAARVVQAFLGALTAAFLAGAGARWGGRSAGLAVGILAAIYGPLVFFDAELLVPNLLLFLLSAAVLLFSGTPRVHRLALGGACLGLAAAARPNALVLVPLVAFWVWRMPGMCAARRRRAGIGILVLGFLPVLAVAGINTVREGAWTGVATHGGVNFYAGNHALATGKSVEIPELRNILTWRQFEGQAREVAEEGAGRPLRSQEVSNWWFERGVRWVVRNPVDAARLYLRKAYYLINGHEIPSNRDLYRDRRGPLRWLLWEVPYLAFPWGLVFPLALAGLVAMWREPVERHRLALLGPWVLLYGLTLLPFFITARFRMGLVPPLLLLAGFALVRFPVWIRRPVPAAVFLLAVLVSNSRLAEVRADNPAQEETRIAEALMREGQTGRAIEALEQARREAPRDIVVAGLLARAYMRESRPRDAIPLLQEVVGARPGDPGPRFDLGAAFLSVEEHEAAANVFETVVEMEPGNAAAWVNLGVASEGRYRFDRAIEAYRRGMALAPGEELAYLNLARVHAHREDWKRAAEVLDTGLERIPASSALREAARAVRQRLEKP